MARQQRPICSPAISRSALDVDDGEIIALGDKLAKIHLGASTVTHTRRLHVPKIPQFVSDGNKRCSRLAGKSVVMCERVGSPKPIPSRYDSTAQYLKVILNRRFW